jgi:Domain of unknown function (DUF4328)
MSNKPKEYVYRDIAKMTSWLRGLLAAGGALAAVGIVSGLNERSILNGFAEAFETETAVSDQMLASADQSDLIQMILGYTQVTVAIVTVVLFARWIVLAARNCHALSDQELEYSPGWSLGWFFVPIANLWKPFSAMRQTWNISADPAGDQEKPAARLVVAWWLLFLVSSTLDRIAFRLGLDAEEIAEIQNANTAMILSDAASIPSIAAAFMLVGAIANMQAATAGKQHSSAAQVTDPIAPPQPS